MDLLRNCKERIAMLGGDGGREGGGVFRFRYSRRLANDVDDLRIEDRGKGKESGAIAPYAGCPAEETA